MRVGGRRLLAVLAGGVVLAGGGVTTLAAWQDQTYDRAPLTLSKFNIEQTVDGSAFAEADDPNAPAILVLKVGAVQGAALSPGVATVGWVGLRAAAGSLGATVTMNAATVPSDPGNLASHLTYQAVAGVDETACRAGVMTGASTTVLMPESSLLSASTNSAFTIPAGTGNAEGPTVGVCVKLRLETNLNRAFSGNQIAPTWQFNAQSTTN